MKNFILKQLRERSSVKGKQKTWVSDLSDDQLYSLFSRLRTGENAKSIASYVQANWGINPGSTTHSLSQGILKYKKRIGHLLISPTTGKGDVYPEHFTGDSAPESTLDALDEIATLQRNRIKDMLAEEKKTGIRYPHLNRDLQALANLERQLLKAKAFELYRGDPVKNRKLAKMEGKIQHQFGQWMQQTPEEERLRMANALGRFLEFAEQHAVTLQVGPDGSYIIPEENRQPD
jgi:hypothetical protein